MRVASTPLLVARAFHIDESFLQNTNARLNEPPVTFQLRFTRAAHADTTLHGIKVCPHALQARQHVLELREFHLYASFVRSRARSKNIENEFGAIYEARAND